MRDSSRLSFLASFFALAASTLSNQDLGPLGTIHYICEFDTYEFAIRASTDRERAYSLGKALQDLFYGVALLR
jgi:hypothetical protein